MENSGLGGNVIENKGSYALEAEILLKIKVLGGRSSMVGGEEQVPGVRCRAGGEGQVPGGGRRWGKSCSRPMRSSRETGVAVSFLSRIGWSPEAYWLPCIVSLMAARPFWRSETARPTAAFRTIDPLKPVRPACSEPKALIR